MEHAVGREGQHVCHRCGWPFPNPHPSAKHRRAHRKQCGKIDGYVLADAASDEEHSDEGHHAETTEVMAEALEAEEGKRIGNLKRSEMDDNGGSGHVVESESFRRDSALNAEDAEVTEEGQEAEEGKGIGNLERRKTDGSGGSGRAVGSGNFVGDSALDAKDAEEVLEVLEVVEGEESGSFERSEKAESGANVVEGIMEGSGEVVDSGNLRSEDSALGTEDAAKEVVEALEVKEGKQSGSLERSEKAEGADNLPEGIVGGSGEVADGGNLSGDAASGTEYAGKEVVKALEVKEERESGSLERSDKGESGADVVEGIVEGSREVVEGGNLSRDAAMGIEDADDTWKRCELSHDSQVRDCGVVNVPGQLEGGMLLEDIAGFCGTSADASSNDKENSSNLVLKDKSLADCFEQKTDGISALDCPAFVNHTDTGPYVENSINVLVPMVPTQLMHPASDSFVVDSELKMDEHTETDVSSNNASASADMTICLYDELSGEMNEANLKSFHPEDKEEDAGGHVPENELFAHAGSCFSEVNASEDLPASENFSRLQRPCDMAGDHKVKGNEDEKLSAPSNLTSVEISEMKSGDCGDNGLTNPYGSLAASGSEARKEPEHHLEDKDPNMIYSKWTPMHLDVSADDVSTTMQLERSNCLHDEPGNRSSMNEFSDNDIVENRHGNVDRSPCINDLKNEAELCLPYCEVVGNLASDGMEAHPHSMLEGSSVAGAIALNRPVTSSCELDVTSMQSEAVETQYSLEGQETCKNLSHKHTSVSDMMAAGVGEGALPDVIEPAKPNTFVEGSELDISEGTQVHYNNAVEGHIPDRCKGDCSQTDSKVNFELASDASEMMPPSDENSREHSLGRDQEINTCTSLGNFVESKDEDGCSQNTKSIFESQLDQVEHKISLQEGFMEVAVDNDIDYSQTGRETEHMGSESPAKECQGELDQQKVQIKHLENIYVSHSDKMDQKEDIHETSADFAVGTNSGQAVTQSEIQFLCGETESNLANLPHEEPDFDVTNEGGLGYVSAQNLMHERPVTSQLEPDPCLQRPVPNEDFKISDIPKDVGSGTCDQSLREEGNLSVLNQHSDSLLVATDASLDSNSQSLSDSVEAQWGSISEITVPSTSHASDGLQILGTGNPPATDTQTANKLHASRTSTEAVATDNNGVDDMSIFEAPSFMTLVEPAKPDSSDIQPMQDPQHAHVKKKNEEIIAKVVNWSPGKPHTPLKNLLMEANFESKQRAGIAQDHHMSLPTQKGQTTPDEGRKLKVPSAKMASENSSDFIGGADHREWNSPARLPVRKNDKRVKGKPTWVPFICCPSMN